MPTPSTVARPAIDSTSRLPIVTASRLRVEALRELQPAAADARDAARCLTACYVSNHEPETALAKPFISDSELCCVAGGGIVIARCSVQCAVCSVQRRARTGRLAARRCSCYSSTVAQVRKTRPCVVQELYLLLGPLAACKDTSKQRAASVLALVRAA